MVEVLDYEAYIELAALEIYLLLYALTYGIHIHTCSLSRVGATFL